MDGWEFASVMAGGGMPSDSNRRRDGGRAAMGYPATACRVVRKQSDIGSVVAVVEELVTEETESAHERSAECPVALDRSAPRYIEAPRRS